MAGNKIKWSKVLAPSDIVAGVVIVVGILIAVFIQEMAVRLIGISIAILGGVAIFMLISQRLSEMVESGKFRSKNTPDYKISIKKSEDAKRQVFEDYEDEFHSEKESADTGEAETLEKDEDEPEKKPEMAESKKEDKSDFAFQDQFSGVRIIGKSKSKPISPEKHVAKEKKDTDRLVFKTKPERPRQGEQSERLEFEETEIPEKETAPETDKIVEEIDNKRPVDLIEDLESQDSIAEIIEDADVAEEEQEESLPKEDYIEKKVDLNISELIESEEISGKEPRKEFNYILNKVLGLIRTFSNSQTAAFLMINKEKQQLVLESYNSSHPDKIIRSRKIALGDDAISVIYKEVKAEILTEIDPGAIIELIPYYAEESELSSFVGVPVFFKGNVIGVLCADSVDNEAYDGFTVKYLGQFTKLISALVAGYTEKYDLVLASRTLKAINEFIILSGKSGNDPSKLTNSLIQSVSKLVEYDTIGLVMFDDDNDCWKILALRTKNEESKSLLGENIELKNTLTGYSLVKSKTVFLDDNKRAIKRFSSKEKDSNFGYFVSIPIKTSTTLYGALFIEGMNRNGISTNDIDILENLSIHAGNAFERLRLNTQLITEPVRKEKTDILTPNQLYESISKEVERSNSGLGPFTFAMVKLDKYSTLDSSKYPERYRKALDHVFDMLSDSKHSYDLFGKIDDDTIGVVIIGSNASEAKIWAERFRTDTANSTFTIDNTNLNVTISIGLAEYKEGTKLNDLINNCMNALTQAREKTNSVIVFT